jgi:hypothetical protein
MVWPQTIIIPLHQDSHKPSPHLLTSPIFGFMARGAADRWDLEHITRPFIHQCHFNFFVAKTAMVSLLSEAKFL